MVWMWLPGVFGAIFPCLGSVQVKTSPNQFGSVWHKALELPAPAGHRPGDHGLGKKLSEKAGTITKPTHSSCGKGQGQNTFRITVWMNHFVDSCQDIFCFSFFQSNLIDSQSSSLSSLNATEDFEEYILDRSFASSQQDTSLHQGN